MTAPPPTASPDPKPATGFLSAGFRPFFLMAGLYAAFAIPVWLAVLAGVGGAPGDGDARLWHGHEMVFGLGSAAICGFLLTALPNWTGRPPVRGLLLGLLAAIWLAGRLVWWLPGLPEALRMVVGPAILPVLVAIVLRELVAARKWNNLPLAGVIGMLALADLAVHAGGGMAGGEAPQRAVQTGLMILVLLITLIGGRITPVFTGNALVRRGLEPKIRRRPLAERLAIAGMATSAVLAAVLPEAPATGAVALATAGALAARMTGWRTRATGPEPILWVLHLGSLWLVVGMLLRGLGILVPEIPLDMAWHALGAGAAGTMIMAVTSRAALGHSGRPLVAPPVLVAAYLLVSLAAVLRVFAPLLPDAATLPGLMISGGAWSLAWALFTISLWPVLVRR